MSASHFLEFCTLVVVFWYFCFAVSQGRDGNKQGRRQWVVSRISAVSHLVLQPFLFFFCFFFTYFIVFGGHHTPLLSLTHARTRNSCALTLFIRTHARPHIYTYTLSRLLTSQRPWMAAG